MATDAEQWSKMLETKSTTGPLDTTTSQRPTHYCETCDEQLVVLADDPIEPVQCNNCHGHNTRRLADAEVREA